MALTKDDKAFLYKVVHKILKDIQQEESTINEYTFPGFIAAERKYEAFLKGLKKKLK